MIAVSAVVKNRIVKRLVGKYDLGENLIFSRITRLGGKCVCLLFCQRFLEVFERGVVVLIVSCSCFACGR